MAVYNWVDWLSIGNSVDFDKRISNFHDMQLPCAVWQRLLEHNTVALSSLPSALVVKISFLDDFVLPPASPHPIVLRDACTKDQAVKLLCGSSVTSDDLDNELRHRWQTAVAEGLLDSSDTLTIPPTRGFQEEVLTKVQHVRLVERQNLPVHITYVQRGHRIFRSGWECRVTAQGTAYFNPNRRQERSLDVIPDFVKAPISSAVAHIPQILPNGWERRLTEAGHPYHVDHVTRTTSWNPPPIHDEERNLRQDPGERRMSPLERGQELNTEENQASIVGENLPTADSDGRSNSDSGKGKEKEGVEDSEKEV
ncbi:hypothetical protein C8R45DRAFT_1184366 [Mycena sanguinolenta]|nr:hypothetical protein C8R45DRAFT_1184366 [Mycena sanguinolenta]